MSNEVKQPALQIISGGRIRAQRMEILEECFLEYILEGAKDTDKQNEYYNRLMEADLPFRPKANLKVVDSSGAHE